MKQIILTGGASGIGRAIIEHLVNKVDLFVIDKDEKAGISLEQSLASSRLHFFYGDLAKQEDLDEFIRFVLNNTKNINGIIHNAAINHGGLLSKASLEEFMEVMQVNVGTAYYLTQRFEPYFSDSASVVLMSSTRSRQSMANNESYSSSKGALLSLTHAMANSLRGKARINAISPGWIDTAEYQLDEQNYEMSKEDASQHLVNRVGHPYDIVHMVDYLLDEKKSSFITGQEIVIDGGMSKQMIYHDEQGWTYK